MARNPIFSMALQSGVEFDVEAAAPAALDRAARPDRGERRERSRAALAAPGAGRGAPQGRAKAATRPTRGRAPQVRRPAQEQGDRGDHEPQRGRSETIALPRRPRLAAAAARTGEGAMNPRPEDVDALARAIDRVVFAETGGTGATEAQ